MVSTDTAISLAFGIISIFISLLGVWISYLTLRAMNLDPRSDSNQPPIDREQVLRHEHTFVIPRSPLTRKRIPSMA
ncbi:hypothetical protein V8E51_014023 [Hyaloscypha variabilis]